MVAIKIALLLVLHASAQCDTSRAGWRPGVRYTQDDRRIGDKTFCQCQDWCFQQMPSECSDDPRRPSTINKFSQSDKRRSWATNCYCFSDAWDGNPSQSDGDFNSGNIPCKPRVGDAPEHPSPVLPTTESLTVGDAPAHPPVSPTSEATVCTQLRVPPKHVFTSTNEDGGALVVNRWFDDVLVKARLEFVRQDWNMTIILGCNDDGNVVKTSYDTAFNLCSTKVEPVQCIENGTENPFFALWGMGNADILQANCTGPVDCQSSAGQCEVWSMPTNGSYDGDTIDGTLHIYINSEKEEVDTFSLTKADGTDLGSVPIDIWDATSPRKPEVFSIPEEWNCPDVHLPVHPPAVI